MPKLLLGTITDEPTLSRDDFDRLTTLKHGAFGFIVKNSRVAVVYAQNEGHHELPGGGADEGETPQQNLQREILEEVGYAITDLAEIGVIREVWSATGIETFSTLFVARAVGEPQKVTLTDKEIKRGITLKWLTYDELRRTIISENPDTLMGRMKHGRDVIALRALGENEDLLRQYLKLEET